MPGVSKAAGSLTAGCSYWARRSMPDRRCPGRRRSMPVRRSCSGPPGGPRCCWRLSVCARRSSRARRSPRPRRSPGVGGLLGLAEPVSPGRASSVSLGLPFLSVGRFMPVYLPLGSCSAARHRAPTRRVLQSLGAFRRCLAKAGVLSSRPSRTSCTMSRGDGRAVARTALDFLDRGRRKYSPRRPEGQAEHGWGGRHRDAAGARSTEAVEADRSSGHGLPPGGRLLPVEAG